MVMDQPERKKSKAEFWRTRPLLVPFPPPGNSNTDPLPERTAFGIAEIKRFTSDGHGFCNQRGLALIGNPGADDADVLVLGEGNVILLHKRSRSKMDFDVSRFAFHSDVRTHGVIHRTLKVPGLNHPAAHGLLVSFVISIVGLCWGIFFL